MDASQKNLITLPKYLKARHNKLHIIIRDIEGLSDSADLVVGSSNNSEANNQKITNLGILSRPVKIYLV